MPMWIEAGREFRLRIRKKGESMRKRRGGERGSCSAAALALCAALLAALPGSVYASSPEFSRTEEEWAALRDNRLEYGEIPGLIEEYNPAVQQNRFSYRRFRRDYGDTRDEVSNEYRRLANELLNGISYPDEGDAGYAAGMTAALSSEMQADALLKQADENLEDAEIIRSNYEMAEKQLVRTAMSNMLSWHRGQNALRSAELSGRLAETELAVTEARLKLGMATEAELWTAKKTLQETVKTKLGEQASAENLRQKLQIMLGWKADASPEIAPPPAPEPGKIDRMDPERDLPEALEKNYTLRVNKRKLANALNETDAEVLKSTIADNEARIAASLDGAYQNALAARDAYFLARSEAALSARTAEETAQRYRLGLAGKTAEERAAVGAEQAELSLKNSELSLLQAIEDYDWAVNGLASAAGN